MKNKLFNLGCFLLLGGALILAGCQASALTGDPDPLAPTAVATAMPRRAVLSPLDARDLAIEYLGKRYPSQAPASGLSWMEQDATPQGLVGSSARIYRSGEWTMILSWMVVHPDLMVYQVKLNNAVSGFEWQGQVNAAGAITEGAVSPARTPAPEPYIGIPQDAVEDWAGTLISNLPGAQFDDYFERDGERYGIDSLDPETRQRLIALRDKGLILRVWGKLLEAADVNGLQIQVTKLEAEAPQQVVDGWVGRIIKLPAGSQFGQYFLREDGERFGIAPGHDALRAQFDELRASDYRVKVWGKLYLGVPATEARQIEAQRLEALPAV
jgi:hypothetical protein